MPERLNFPEKSYHINSQQLEINHSQTTDGESINQNC